jgi:hypothetical protein
MFLNTADYQGYFFLAGEHIVDYQHLRHIKEKQKYDTQKPK